MPRLAELEQAWADGGYHGFCVLEHSVWSAISSSGEVLTGNAPDGLDQQFTDRRLPSPVSDLGFYVAYMFATAKSKDQRGRGRRGRSMTGSAGPPSLVTSERGEHPWPGWLTSPGRSRGEARRTWRTPAGPVGKQQIRAHWQALQ